MDLLYTNPNAAVNSDLAFWGNHAFIGYYTGDAAPRGGVRVFDISNPASPTLVKDIQCDGLQNDPIIWDRNEKRRRRPSSGRRPDDGGAECGAAGR